MLRAETSATAAAAAAAPTIETPAPQTANASTATKTSILIASAPPPPLPPPARNNHRTAGTRGTHTHTHTHTPCPWCRGRSPRPPWSRAAATVSRPRWRRPTPAARCAGRSRRSCLPARTPSGCACPPSPAPPGSPSLPARIEEMDESGRKRIRVEGGRIGHNLLFVSSR